MMAGQVRQSPLAVDAADPVEIPAAPAAVEPRWHHLDALRGFAMLLGIGLHAALSFFPWVWAVQDSTATADGFFDEFFHAVHGFRMPLFFLLSGFFTAMLWRRRGLTQLLSHRARRILIPFVLAALTIVPLTSWSVSWAVENGISDYIEEHEDIWAAVFFGNVAAVEALLDSGVDVNAPNRDEGGDTPLHVAAYTGDVEMVGFLLARGADPNLATVDGPPLAYAAYLGHEPVADALVAGGAIDIRAPGQTWQDLDFWAVGASEVVDSDEVLGLESWLGSLFHLWFLWFLALLVVGFAAVALVVDRFGSSWTGSGRMVIVALWILVPVTLVPQLAMGGSGETPVFGPDTSTGLVPIPHVLAYYAVFFTFGALLYGRPGRKGKPLVEGVGRWWFVLLPLAAVLFPVALWLTFDTEGRWLEASIAQVAFTWLMIFGLFGAFGFLFSERRPGVRYLSDSAYWLYLMHLPLVIIGASLIRNWDLPAGEKFLQLTVVVTVGLLVTYQLFVRYTPIGTMLNGRRTRPRRAKTAVVSAPDA